MVHGGADVPEGPIDLDAVRVAFDEERLISDAGLLVTAASAPGPDQAFEPNRGDLVRIRLYNASNLNHSMHLHGHDMVLVSKNGHAVPQIRETTQDVAPGDFFEVEFKADNPSNWIFHCHVPHHTSNVAHHTSSGKEDGYEGGPVGMTRVFHYAGYKTVPRGYFTHAGQDSTPAPWPHRTAVQLPDRLAGLGAG